VFNSNYKRLIFPQKSQRVSGCHGLVVIVDPKAENSKPQHFNHRSLVAKEIKNAL